MHLSPASNQTTAQPHGWADAPRRPSTDPLTTCATSNGSALQPPALHSLHHGAAGPPTQHLQGTCSAHCQPEGAPRDCLFKLTFWGQEIYFWLFQRKRCHRSLSAFARGRDALPRDAMAASFVLGCGAQHQLCTTGSSSHHPVLEANKPRRQEEKAFLDSPPGHEGQEHPTQERGWWEAQSSTWGPCSHLGHPQHRQDVFSTHFG